MECGILKVYTLKTRWTTIKEVCSVEEINGVNNIQGEDRLPRRGDLVDAQIIVIEDRGIWLNVGSTKYDAHLPIEEMTDELAKKLKNGELKEGDQIRVVVTGLERNVEDGTIIIKVSQKDLYRREILEKLIRARNEGEVIRVKPTSVEKNRKGVLVDFGYGVIGFIPASQLDMRFVSPEKLDRYVGKNLKVKVLKVKVRSGDVVLSVKAVLKDEMERRKKEFFEKTKPGDIVRGRVVRVTDEYVLVELEKGVVGKVAFSELDWRPIKNPQRFVKRGDIVRAYVVDINPDTEEINLSMRLAKPNPWRVFAEKYPVGSVISGRVLKVTPKVLVIKTGNIVGIVPRSEMTWKKIFNPEELFKRGDYVKAVVKEIDVDGQRAIFSIKDAMPDPWENIEEHYSVGSIVDGIVKAVKDFGAFVEIGEGIEGLVPIKYISWTPFEKIEDVVKVGDKVKVMIRAIMPGERKMTLSIRDTMPDPYKEYQKKHPKGQVVTGVVKEILDNGVILELEPNVKGFIPVSQLSLEKINSISEQFPVGTKVEAKIVGFDNKNRMVRLSKRILDEERAKEELRKYLPDEETGQSSFKLGDILGDLLSGKEVE